MSVFRLKNQVSISLRQAANAHNDLNHIAPIVQQVQRTYPTGVKLTAKAMQALEARFERDPDLEKYFVRIAPLGT